MYVYMYVYAYICMYIDMYMNIFFHIYQFTVKLTFEKFCRRVVKRYCGMIAAEFLTVSSILN